MVTSWKKTISLIIRISSLHNKVSPIYSIVCNAICSCKSFWAILSIRVLSQCSIRYSSNLKFSTVYDERLISKAFYRQKNMTKLKRGKHVGYFVLAIPSSKILPIKLMTRILSAKCFIRLILCVMCGQAVLSTATERSRTTCRSICLLLPYGS